MIKQICDIITTLMVNKLDMTEEEISCLNYGLEIIIRFTFEILLLFSIAFYLNIFSPVLVSTLTFIFLRIKAGGAHLPTYPLCIIVSLIIFITLGKFVAIYTPTLPFLIFWLIFIFFIGLNFINKYAPADTETIPITDNDLRKKVKNQSEKILSGWFILILSLSFYYSEYHYLIFASSLGILAEIISLHPVIFNFINSFFSHYNN